MIGIISKTLESTSDLWPMVHYTAHKWVQKLVVACADLSSLLIFTAH